MRYLLPLRRLRRAPGFAAVATLTLALGIGLSTAVFTIADAVLIRRLPVADQKRLVLLWGATRDGRFANVPLALDDIRTIQRGSTTLADAAFFAFRGATSVPIREQDRVYPVQLALVSGNYFTVLGTRPLLGRTLRSEDDLPGVPPVVVLSYRAWRQRFGGDSSAVGRSITVAQGGTSHTVVGVMPPGPEYPRGAEVWAPLVAYSTAAGFDKIVSRELDILARLRPGASRAQAREELTSYFARPDAPPLQRNVVGDVRSFSSEVLGETRPALIVIGIAAVLLLCISCVNVANLLLIRALDRLREIGVRAALGAGRGRIVAESIVESGVLSLAGGILGVGVAVVAVRSFVLLAPATLPRVEGIAINGGVLLLAILTTCVATVLTGVGPAVLAARVDVSRLLQSGSRTTRNPRLRGLMEGLVVAQVALAVMSLAAGGLVIHSFIRLMRAELSFRTDGLLVAPLVATGTALPEGNRTRAAIDLVVRQLRGRSEIRDVTLSFAPPFVGGGGGIDGRLALPGESAEERKKHPILNLEIAGPDYFSTIGVPVLRGRPISDEDNQGSQRVVVVSASVARHFWPAGDPIGKRLAAYDGDVTVVGVVPDLRFRDLYAARPSAYFPIRQSPFGAMTPTTLLIRTGSSPTVILPVLRRMLRETSPGVTLVSLTSVESLLDGPRATARLNASVLAFFAAAALSLAALGIFAVMAMAVRRRTHELGIRMALGATPANLRRLILGRAVFLAVLGAVIGVAAALASSRSLSALLFQVEATDSVTLAGTALATIIVAVLAGFLPARSSTRIDPMVALRGEA